ncbi:MAG: right-handed parallel beta-helix repeat-containing protein [Candidatus Binatia bacterium]|nr:right-handed parallel beta-helix repeat-containing protein [Candidatus Binatia bacterium]
MSCSKWRCLLLIGLLLAGAGCGSDGEPAGPVGVPGGANACGERCVILSPGDDDLETIQRALIEARPGDTILLRAGRYNLTGQLSLDVDNVTIRGEGHDKTVLSFRNQAAGAEGFLVTANDFTIEDLALEDSPGDLLKILGGNNITIRRVRGEWTRGPNTNNGAYGFYPIECTNVLIEDSVVRGASDAGIYVGQCHNIIVRRNYVYENVAGIEIENSTDADVYQNTATRNTGGILVFNLPGLPFIDGRRTRVFDNDIVENNTANFAAPGTTVSAVPKGTGLMILANDEVQVFGNRFRGNGTSQVLIISYNTAQIIGNLRGNDPRYDKYSETLFIYDNTYEDGGADPDPDTGALIGPITGVPLPDILIDGFEDPRKYVDGKLPDALRICVQDPQARLFNVDLPRFGGRASSDRAPYDCRFPLLPKVVILGVGEEAPQPLPFPSPPPATPTPVAGNVETRCAVGPGNGVNFDVQDEPCEFLSSYRFFVGRMRELQPNRGVVPYDLNTQLFSDYTNKHRFVYLPPGTKAHYDSQAAFDFPVGTVIIKNFAYPYDMRAPHAGERLLETRLLVRREDGWIGLPYVWNAEETEARLRVLGTPLRVSAIQQDGQERTFDYNVPNANQCKECHRESFKNTGPIGTKARNLNKTFNYPSGPENQLTYWTRIGILQGAPVDPETVPRAAVLEDPSTGTVEERARTYLDVNCAHCHNPAGAARTTGLYLGISETEPLRLGICKSPVAAGRGTGGFRYDIEPGKPDQSILLFRMISLDPGIAMPELGRRRVHEEAIEVIREWIASLPGDCSAQ